MRHNRSPWSPVQAFVTVHMQRAMAEGHGSSVSSVSGRDLKTAPSQGAFMGLSHGHMLLKRANAGDGKALVLLIPRISLSI